MAVTNLVAAYVDDEHSPHIKLIVLASSHKVPEQDGLLLEVYYELEAE